MPTDGPTLYLLLVFEASFLLDQHEVPLMDAGFEIGASGFRDRQRRRLRPRLHMVEPCAAHQEARIAFGSLPFGGGAGESLVLAEVLSVAIDPRAQAPPGSEQRLVRDLDGRLARRGLTVERQQAMA